MTIYVDADACPVTKIVEQVMVEFDISRATVFRDYAKIKKITGAVYDKNESVWKL